MENKVANTESILTFGELLLRFCIDANGNWLNENRLPFYVGGAELNVATALSLWGIPTKFFTSLPDNDLSAQIIDHLISRNIDTSAIHKGGSRLGLFYLTKGKDMKHNAVIYDRAGSAFAELTTNTIDWDEVFKGIGWFHFSAICPALSEQTANLCEEVLIAASKRNVHISVDLNYRAKLWQYGKEPVEIMRELVKYCDLIMGNIWAADKLLDITVTPGIHEQGQKNIYLKEALHNSELIIQRFPKCKTVANTFRFDVGTGINYYTTLYTDKKLYHSAEYSTATVTDKVGSGDCFMAGLIYGFYNHFDPSNILSFATAAAFEKLFIAGDATTSTVEEINNSIKYEN